MYVFGVFVDNRGGGGPQVNVFLRVYFDAFRQTLRFNFRPSKQSSFYIFGIFVYSRGTGTLVNEFLSVYFDVFRQTSPFNFRPSKQSSFYIFGVFVDSRGGNRARYLCFEVFIGSIGGTPDKRISEGLF